MTVFDCVRLGVDDVDQHLASLPGFEGNQPALL